MAERDTIFALSSGQLPAAIAVIRVSGPQALEVARALTGRELPPPRRAGLRRFIDPRSGELLDEALLLCFPGPNTETGEDMVELQCHGSRAVVRGVQAALEQMPGCRLAEPGEFTRRAFVNGKTDLAGIEGLGDLIAAETALQRRAAMAMLGGGLSRRIEQWTGRLRTLAAQVEARIDFSDEGDVVDAGALGDLREAAAVISEEMMAELRKPSADRLKDGIRVAIGGPPNAGKSSLFNYLVGRDAAIVSPHAGTTRDVIEATIALRGIPIVLSDTAGLREAVDGIERIGIGRAEALLGEADIVLWLGPVEEQPPMAGGVAIQVASKRDLGGLSRDAQYSVSALTGEGIEPLIDRICDEASSLLPAPGDYALSARQRAVLVRAQSVLDDMPGTDDEVLLAESLRQATIALDEIIGRATTEAMLDELFQGFCIGK